MRDNLCKYLAEQYPTAFTQWLLKDSSPQVSILKTELSLEPIRADSVTFVQTQDRILHLEFQVEPQTEPPLPLRMLDYWVRLHRKYACEIVQVLILLRRTTIDVPTAFETETTLHRYRVIKLWEEDPQQFFSHPALLPFAVLGQTRNSEALLRAVAERVNQIEPESERRELSTAVQLMAGLQYKEELIESIFREGMMRESVMYQKILREGEQQGLKRGLERGLQRGRQEGRQEEACSLILRQLHRRLGHLPDEVIAQIRDLSLEQLETLGEALLDFQTLPDLQAWLRTCPH
ncbi:Rpn family recombination-promoting nuclease/putative transposase [Thermosynechococcaceae cyanobacterium Okahandja]